jgi:3-(3-hydroxy-phenyl)propionate hydroxylase
MVHPIPETVDVLIVGYGPVGAAVAALLGRYGVRTLVVDKAPDILMAPRAIALDNEALRILQMVGLPEDAFEKVAIPHVRMHCPHVGEFSRLNTSGSIDGHPKLVTFYQPDLERALRKRAEDHTSVETLACTEMRDFVEENDGIRAMLKLEDGSVAVVKSRYLVGADGAGSKVRKAIGQDFGGKTYAEDWLIVDARNVPGAFDHVEFICDPARPTPHMIAPGGRIRWEFMLRPGESREEMEKDQTIARLLAPWAKAGALEIERKAVYRFHARSCERYSKGRVFLVGDAAHITPPFVGQGLVAGLRDAANLAWKLAFVIKGNAAPAILETYDQERRPHATKMIGLAKLMGGLVMPSSRFMAVLIHGTMALLRRMPGLR